MNRDEVRQIIAEIAKDLYRRWHGKVPIIRAGHNLHAAMIQLYRARARDLDQDPPDDSTLMIKGIAVAIDADLGPDEYVIELREPVT